jgi:signal transduction histidine kinase
MAALMFLAVSPWVFSGITVEEGAVVPVPGPLIVVFSPALILFFLSTIWLLVRKYLKAEGAVKGQWRSIGVGFGLAYILLLYFVFIRVSLFHDVRFVPYSPLFILPIFCGAAYAILRHRLFSIKVIAAETLTFILLVASFIELYLASGTLERILSVLVTTLTLIFGVLLVRSVIKEVKQREELQELYKKLEELSRFKTELLSLASHQLRSPLSAIKGFAELLEEGAYGALETRSKEAIGKMKNSAQELLDLINMLLDMRKVDEGRMEYSLSRTNLTDMTKKIVDGIRPLALKKSIELNFEATGPIFANVDEKISQVIHNLIDNAIKYTPAGYVRVALSEKEGTVQLSVVDTGLGISADMLPHIFEEFSRDNKVKKKILGTGLGLYIAKKIAEAHGGTVWAESAGEGKGSHFNLKFPADRPVTLPTSAS